MKRRKSRSAEERPCSAFEAVRLARSCTVAAHASAGAQLERRGDPMTKSQAHHTGRPSATWSAPCAVVSRRPFARVRERLVHIARPARPARVRLPDIPAQQPPQRRHLARPRRPQLGELHRGDRRLPSSSCRLRLQPHLRHALRRRRPPPAEGPDPLHRIRPRIASPARTRCRATRPWRALAKKATSTCSCCSRAPAGSTSSTTRAAPGGAGKPARAPCSTSAATHCGPKDGPPRTPPACPSSRSSPATPKCVPARSTTPCA